MTPELQHRLDCELPPFNGFCVYNVDDLTLSQLRALLEATVKFLVKDGSDLESFHDWHEHDGFVVDSKSTSWQSLHEAIQTERTLFDSRVDDFEVSIAVYPRSFAWLLRFNVDQGDEQDYKTSTCDFDLSFAVEADSSGVMNYLLDRFPELLEKRDANGWFNANCGGKPPVREYSLASCDREGPFAEPDFVHSLNGAIS